MPDDYPDWSTMTQAQIATWWTMNDPARWDRYAFAGEPDPELDKITAQRRRRPLRALADQDG